VLYVVWFNGVDTAVPPFFRRLSAFDVFSICSYLVVMRVCFFRPFARRTRRPSDGGSLNLPSSFLSSAPDPVLSFAVPRQYPLNPLRLHFHPTLCCTDVSVSPFCGRLLRICALTCMLIFSHHFFHALPPFPFFPKKLECFDSPTLRFSEPFLLCPF